MTTLQCDCGTIFRVDRGVINDINQSTIPCPDCQRPVRTKNMSDEKPKEENVADAAEEFSNALADATGVAWEKGVNPYAMIGLLERVKATLLRALDIEKPTT